MLIDILQLLIYGIVLGSIIALGAIGVGLDLVSAHAQAPMDQQVATAETALEERHAVPRLAPGQSITLDGQVQLALAQAQVIRQGRHPLLVPLLRMRISARGGDALLRTFVVGQTTPGSSRVQPIRRVGEKRWRRAVAPLPRDDTSKAE